MSAAKKVARSRATEPYPFDFATHPRPAAEHAAGAVAAADLRTLFERLDGADENFGTTGATQRAAGLDALAAVVQFLTASPFNANGRFSRPLELLSTELRRRPLSRGARILPDDGGGAGGVDSRASDAHVRAAAAFTLDFLHKHAAIPVVQAAGDVADLLEKSGFIFGERRSGDKGAAVMAWRRDYSRARRTEAGGNVAPASRPAPIFRGHCAQPPCAATGEPSADRGVALAWFGALLARAGYGATT